MVSCVLVRRKQVKIGRIRIMERIMNEENEWDHNVKGDTVEGPVVSVSGEEMLQALNKMKTGKSFDLQKYH